MFWEKDSCAVIQVIFRLGLIRQLRNWPELHHSAFVHSRSRKYIGRKVESPANPDGAVKYVEFLVELILICSTKFEYKILGREKEESEPSYTKFITKLFLFQQFHFFHSSHYTNSQSFISNFSPLPFLLWSHLYISVQWLNILDS